MTNKKDISVFILGILFAGSLVLSHYLTKTKIEVNHDEVITNFTKEYELIKGFKEENKVLHKNLERMVKERLNFQQLQQNITKTYKNIYEKINATTDTLQYNTTLELLTKHRETKLERD